MDKIVKISIIIGMLFLIISTVVFLKDSWSKGQEYCDSCIPMIVDTYAKKYDSGGVELLSRKTSTEEISKLAHDTQKALENDYCFKKCIKGFSYYKKRDAVIDAYIKQIAVIRANRKSGLR
ncbi:MAG TPA: hypothetical protein DCL35_07280 [Candidatus Omnitrophica bacterium]|nr:hypothetical protein [Candidatus Omnitrophota bacterium]